MEDEKIITETPAAPGSTEEGPVVETQASDAGFKALSDEEVANYFKTGGVKPEVNKDVTVSTTESPVAPVLPVVEKKEEPAKPIETEAEFIKIPKTALSGIFDDGDLGVEKIVDRLKTANLNKEEREALEKAKVLRERPDIQSLVNHALRPGANIRHYVDLMESDVTKLSDFDAVVQLGVLEGKNPDQYKSRLKGEYMQFPDEEYPEYSGERLQSMKDAAAMKLAEDGASARDKIKQMQADAQRPVEEVQTRQENKEYTEKVAAAKQSWASVKNTIPDGMKVQSELKFKNTEGNEQVMPFTFELNKPERVAEINKYVDEYIDTVITFNPDYVPNEETIKEARKAATARYVTSHIDEIFSRIAEDVTQMVDLEWAKKTNSPYNATHVDTNTQQPVKRGMQPVSDTEVREMLDRV